MRVASSVKLTEDEERQLAKWSRGRSTPQRTALRSNIALFAARGWENRGIASELHTRQNTVSLWRSRFLSHRIGGIAKGAPRPGRTPRISQKKADEIIERTLHTKPKARPSGARASREGDGCEQLHNTADLECPQDPDSQTTFIQAEQRPRVEGEDRCWDEEWKDFRTHISKPDQLGYGLDGVRALQVVEAAYQSAKTGTAVKMGRV